MKTATPRFSITGFRSTGIYPFNQDVLSETVSAHSSVSERPLKCNVNQGQEITSGSKYEDLSATHKKVKITRSTSVDRSCPGYNAFSGHWSITLAPRRSLNMNSTLAAKDLFQCQGKEEI
jgi:hypothetical protein